MGVSVENADYVERIEHLRQVGAHVKFLSLEPLLGPLRNLDLRGIDWVIVGGESGPGARPVEPAWVIEIVTNASRLTSRSSLSNGAALTKGGPGVSLKVGHGTKCRRRW